MADQGSRLSDAGLLAAYARGGAGAQEAFEQLVAIHGGMVFHTCLRLCGSREAAEDAAQATLLVLANKASSVRGNVGAFLHGVAHNVAHRAWEAERARRAREKEAAQMKSVEDAGPRGSGTGDWAAVRPLLDEAITRLPAGEGAAVILHYLEGKSQGETSVALGIPEGTVGSRINRAMGRMREFLRRRGVTMPALALAGILAQRSGEASCPAFLSSAASAIATVGGTAAGGVVSAEVAALAKEALNVMLWTKIRMVAAVLAVVVAGICVPVAAMSVLSAKGDKPEPAAPNAAPAARRDLALKPGWEDKRAVQLSDEGDAPVWSPDRTRAAFRYARYDVADRTPRKLLEAGVGVVDLVTGAVSKAVLVRDATGPVESVHFLSWRANGKSLLAATGGRIWSISVAGAELKAAGIAPLPPGAVLLEPSPDELSFLCAMEGRRRQNYFVLNGAGREVASFAGREPVWSGDSKALLYGHDEELRRTRLTGGEPETLLTADDYFQGNRPAISGGGGYVWGLTPVKILENGDTLVQVWEANRLGADDTRAGKVVSVGQVFLWKRAAGKNEFTNIGPTRSGLHGTEAYLPVGRKGLLLRHVSPAPHSVYKKAREIKEVVQLVDALTGKARDMDLPADVEVGWLIACDHDGGSPVFLGWRPKEGAKRTDYSERERNQGLVFADMDTGKLQYVDLPVAVGPRMQYQGLFDSAGRRVLLSARLKVDPADSWKPGLAGVWLIDAGGKGILTQPVDPRQEREARERHISALAKYITKYMGDVRKYPDTCHDFARLRDSADQIEKLGKKEEANEFRQQIQRLYDEVKDRLGRDQEKAAGPDEGF